MIIQGLTIVENIHFTDLRAHLDQTYMELRLTEI